MSPDDDAPRSASPAPSLVQRLGRLRETPGTAAIVVACLAVYAYTALKADPTGTQLLRLGATERSHVWRGEYWRLFTAMFQHGGLLHLGMNLFFGSTWNAAVERVLGTFRFLLLYLLSGVFASATSVLLHDGSSVGASGAMFGMIGAVLALQYRGAGSFNRFWRNPGVRSLLFNVAIWVAIGFSATDLHFDNWAHVGGFAYGAVLGYVLLDFIVPVRDDGEPAAPTPPRERAAHWVHWAMALTVLGFVAAAACRRWPTQRSQLGGFEAYQASAEAHEAGDVARARREIDQAIGFDDRVPDYFVARAALREEQGDLRGGVDDLEHALRVAPASWKQADAVRRALDELRTLAGWKAEGAASAAASGSASTGGSAAPSATR
jgi:membrane associated rhomboid family serine protease